MNNMRNKILMTLALLLTAVTGAWAADTFTITFSANGKNKTYTDVVLPAEYKCEYGSPGEFDKIIQELYEQDGGHAIENATPTVTGTDAITPAVDGPNDYAMITITAPFTGKATVSGTYSGWSNSGSSINNYSIEITCAPTEPAITVKWDPATKTGNFSMPAYDVEIAPIYAPVAQWAKVDNVDQLPTAIEGIFAGTEDAIVNAGTVVEGQGTAMYFATTDAEMTAEKAAKAEGWLSTLPTAAGYDGAQTVYVWYYIKGADTPEGEKATAENTFNDSEICAEPIKVTLLSNKFDIQFKAANDNTIEAGKATVKVGDEAAEVDAKGNLTGVKMNSKVTVTAKEGYKFRKVEVKKAAPATTVTWNSSDFYFDPNPYTKDGVTLTPSNDMAANGNNLYQFGDNTFTTTLGKFIKIEIEFESTTYTFDGWTKGTGGQYQPDPQTYPDKWENLLKLTWTGDAESVTIKGKDVFGIHSITFTIQ